MLGSFSVQAIPMMSPKAVAVFWQKRANRSGASFASQPPLEASQRRIGEVAEGDHRENPSFPATCDHAPV